jgi:hypothetical protein
MAKAQRVTFLKVNLKDQPGVLLGVMQDLKAKNISLTALWGYSKAEGNADMFALAKKPDKLRSALQASGLTFEEGTGFFLKGVDKAGVLLKSLETLAKANVNIKGTHALAVGGKFGSLFLFDPADNERAAQALG